jgi:hypothetical protein
MRVGLGLHWPLESKTPATMLAEIEDRAAASAATLDGDASLRPTLARGLTAARRRRRGAQVHGSGATYASAAR